MISLLYSYKETLTNIESQSTNPVVPLHERYRTLMAIKYIDEVYVYQTEEELYKLIEFFKLIYRILGEDYIGKPFR